MLLGRLQRPPIAPLAAAAIAAVPVAALGAADGGFFPRPWGWAALGLALVLGAALVSRRQVSASRRPLVLLGVLAALFVWVAASLAWTRSVGLGVLELQRLLVYLAAVGGAALVVHARNVRALVAGVFVGTTGITVSGLVVYLVTREHAPDVFQGAYLHRPMGYANAMAIASAMAILLGLGLSVGAASRRARVAAAVALVPLASALALTGSRAAQTTLVVGAGVTVALEPERARMLRAWGPVLVVPALAALAVFSFHATSSGIVGAPADALGNRLLALVLGLSALAVRPALRSTRTEAPRTRRAPGRLWGAVGIVALAALLAGGVTRFPGVAGDRPLFWHVALEEFRESPLLGSGAGTFSQVWLERRPVAVSVRDAHSVVIESLAELGVCGAVLVCLLLALPLAWAFRARSRPLAPAVGGAFAAYAVHASVDWDWEMPAVTIAGLCCAVAIGAAADDGLPRRRISGGARRVAVALAVTVAAVAAVGLLGASALEDANRSLARGDAAAAAREAERAARWQPWSAEPLLVGGQARLLLGDRSGAGARFARAAAREPSDHRTWLALAAVTDGEVARAALRRARALDPRAVRVHHASRDEADTRKRNRGREAR